MAGSTTLPKPVLERLPRYLRVLEEELGKGTDYISSSALGELTGVDEFQVRQDLRYVRASGRPGKGYPVKKLGVALRQMLGLDTPTRAAVIGAGRLGQAITLYPGFERYGLKVFLLFDADPRKIGRRVGDLMIMDISRLPHMIGPKHIDLAILTVPAEVAQETADLAVRSGIKALWNFAPVRLKVPEDVHVRNEELSIGLATLVYHLKREEVGAERANQ